MGESFSLAVCCEEPQFAQAQTERVGEFTLILSYGQVESLIHVGHQVANGAIARSLRRTKEPSRVVIRKKQISAPTRILIGVQGVSWGWLRLLARLGRAESPLG